MESNLLSTLQYCGSLPVYSTVLCLLVFGLGGYSLLFSSPLQTLTQLRYSPLCLVVVLAVSTDLVVMDLVDMVLVVGGAVGQTMGLGAHISPLVLHSDFPSTSPPVSPLSIFLF